MSSVFIYVVDRDFGFAPNPFHNLCTLATCKPITRRVATVDDWVVGMGGSRLKATGKCVFAMKVSKVVSFEEYWTNPLYANKKPLRNGSRKMIVGDNIYSKVGEEWHQVNSHHSNPDGTPNLHNLVNDTKTNAVLVSDHFFYFGSGAVQVPQQILKAFNYKNGRHHRRFPLNVARGLIGFLELNYKPNYLYADPFDFENASARFSGKNNRVIVESQSA